VLVGARGAVLALPPMRRQALLATVVLAACGRNAEPPPPVTGDAVAPPPAESCQQLTRRAWDRLTPVLKAADADLSCQTDEDCVDTSIDTGCTAACGTLANRRGAAAIAAAIAQIDVEICAAFVQQRCFRDIPPCVPRIPGVACLAGRCGSYPPAAWRSLSIDRRGAGSVPPSCTAGQDCTVWEVTSGGALTKIDGGKGSAATLAPAELGVVDGILRSEPFRLKESAGFGCAALPAGESVSLVIQRDRGTFSFDIGGCLAGQSDADLVKLHEVVSAH
jgi:hypothetical protein